jgi:glyoxylase-like metal-dependent hydrolase (beta-lactamase superfamily II)
MSEMTRRTALAGAAATALAPLGSSTAAQAAAPASGKQAPGFYRLKVGSYEVTVLLDGVRRTKLEQSPIRNATLDQVKAELAARHLPTDQTGIYFHPIVVNTGSKLVLIDTGNGPGSRQAGTGQVPDNLTAAGIDPKAIDVVLISHFHGDHISGLRTPDGALAYPNAEIMVPAKEWAHWSDEGAASRAPQNQQATFQNTKRIFGPVADKIAKFEWGKEVLPGITAQDTHGHTPGHTAFVVASGSQSMLYQADVTANIAPLIVTNPSWQIGGDMDGPQAEATRRKLYDQLAADRTVVSGYHFAFPSLGYIEKAGSGYRLIPASWNPTL